MVLLCKVYESTLGTSICFLRQTLPLLIKLNTLLMLNLASVYGKL